MKLKHTDIPHDSQIWGWIRKLSLTELPLTYQVFSALSIIGALVKRNVWVDQGTKIYPNMSLLLVGPSGIGKDVQIGYNQRALESVGTLPDVSGTTIEFTKDELLKVGDPAAAYILAPEITAYMGGKDYQKNIMTELTDLLSTGASCSIGLKGTGKRIIPRPTITMFAGSTQAWLAQQMPKGSVDGGFLPRFIIICEGRGTKSVAWVKYDNTLEDRRAGEAGLESFHSFIKDLAKAFGKPFGEMVPLVDARDMYRTFYENRFKKFGPLVEAYANRSRDMALRLATCVALSRGKNFISETDMKFALKCVEVVAESIEQSITPILAAQERKDAWMGGRKEA